MTGGRRNVSRRRSIQPLRAGLVLVLVACLCLYGALLGPTSGSDGNERRLEDEQPPSLLWTLLCAFGLFYMFVALYLVCDEFFVPALDAISEKLNLSPDVAGATFMAAGGSAPEFCTSLLGSCRSTPSDIGICAIVGSAVFNVLAVIGACGLAARSDLKLTWYPLLRDSIFYVVDLLAITWSFQDGQITIIEASILFGLYILYCIFMAFSGRVEEMFKSKKEAQEEKELKERFKRADTNHDGVLDTREAAQDAEFKRDFQTIDANHDGKLSFDEVRGWRILSQRNHEAAKAAGDEEVPNEPVSLCPPPSATCCQMAWYLLTLPLNFLLVCTVPDVRRDCCRLLYVPAFFLSIAWIVLFSKVMIDCTEVVGLFTGIPTQALALTLLAWGTSVPDMLTSVLVTLQDHGDMAISSSIGSNIFDVTVGLPVPWLIYLCIYGGTFPVGSDGMMGNILMLMGMLAFTIGSIMLNGWVLNKCLGIMLLVLWVGFTVYSVVMLYV